MLILAASITTGYTVQAAIEAINYYGGTVAGLSAIFATATECLGIPVTSIFDPSNLPDYASFDSRECPMCKAGQHIDALSTASAIRRCKPPCPIVPSLPADTKTRLSSAAGSFLILLFSGTQTGRAGRPARGTPP